MVTQGLELFAENLVEDLMRDHPVKRRPTLRWKALRVTAGIAYYRTYEIALSRKLLIDEQRLRDTLIHEYAHLLAYDRFGPKAANHGPEWRTAMRELGAKPERTHCYQVDRNKTRQRVTYECQRCGKHLFRTRRLPSKHRYFHVDCGGGLKLISVEATTNSDLPS